MNSAWRLLLLVGGMLLLVAGLGAESFARQDPAVNTALDYARAPVGAPPPDFHLHLARAAWVRPLSLGAVPLAFFAFWITFGPRLLQAPRAPRAEGELANAFLLATLPTGLALSVLIQLPLRLDRSLEALFASIVPLQVVPARLALSGAVGLVSFLGALWFRLRRPEAPWDESETPREVISAACGPRSTP